MGTGLRHRLHTAATLIALALAGATAAHAAGAPLTSAQLGAETTLVSSCVNTGVDVDYDIGYSPTHRQYVINKVHLGGMDPSCDGQQATTTLTGPDGILTTGTTRLDDTGQVTIHITPTPVAHLTGIAVQVTAD